MVAVLALVSTVMPASRLTSITSPLQLEYAA
jgi:hypothetical protein